MVFTVSLRCDDKPFSSRFRCFSGEYADRMTVESVSRVETFSVPAMPAEADALADGLGEIIKTAWDARRPARPHE
jgi:hypothetical protein